MSSETGQPLKPDILKMMLPNFQPSTKRTLRCKTYHHSDMPATIFLCMEEDTITGIYARINTKGFQNSI